MKKYYKILFLSLFLAVSTSGFSQSPRQVGDAEKLAPIELVINGEKTEISNMPQNARLEIFSIIGSKVASIDVKSGLGEGTLSLPRGYYIIKANNSARKIAVK